MKTSAARWCSCAAMAGSKLTFPPPKPAFSAADITTNIINEAFYIIDGEIEISLVKGEQKEKVTVKNGDFFVLKPYAVHSFLFKQNTTMVALYDKGVEEENGVKDIYPAEV